MIPLVRVIPTILHWLLAVVLGGFLGSLYKGEQKNTILGALVALIIGDLGVNLVNPQEVTGALLHAMSFVIILLVSFQVQLKRSNE